MGKFPAIFELKLKLFIDNFLGATPATPSNATNHNHTTASNFKRQNTVDSATIKENTARINSASAATRPTAAKNAVNITSLDAGKHCSFLHQAKL